MSVRFLADADLNEAIVIGVLGREAALDFLTARHADLEGRSDPDVLEFAASQGRTLVSHDTSTMLSAFFRSIAVRADEPWRFSSTPTCLRGTGR